MREIRRRTRVVGAFPDRDPALMLVAVRLSQIAGTRWGMTRYFPMERLFETPENQMCEKFWTLPMWGLC